jgi:autotransporter-associated beta strand protein
MHARVTRKRLALVAITASMVVAAPSAQAATGTWTGGSTTDGNWSDSLNWLSGFVPGSTSVLNNGDTALFNSAIAAPGNWGNSAVNPVVIDQSTQNIGSITFDAAAGAYFIGSTSGPNSLLLSSGGAINLGTTATSFTGTGTAETINAPLVLEPASSSTAGTYSFVNNSTTASDVLNFGGGISGGTTTAGVMLTLGGANTGNNTISGVVSNGAAAGGVSIAVTGGTWVLNNANTFSGTTNITAGTLNIQNSSALGTGTSTVVLNGTGDLQLQNGVTVNGRALSLTGNTNNPALENVSGANTWGGNITLGTNVTRIFSDAGTLTITGNISMGADELVLENGGAGVISGIISGSAILDHSTTGAGVWIISGPSNYTGATAISNGGFDFENGKALTTTSMITVSSGATLQLQGTITTGTAPLSIAGTGSNVATATGAFENISGNNSYAGAITLVGTTFNPTISCDSGSLSLTNAGNITGNGVTLVLTGAGTGSVAGNLTTTTGGLIKNGAGSWTVAGASTYTGATTVNLGTLSAGVASVAGVSGPFGNNSAVTIANAAGATLNLAGFNTQIASLTGAGTANGAVALGGATLTIAPATASSTAFAGVISGAGNIVFSGTGTQIFSGNNTFGGSGNSVTLNSGTFDINNAIALGNAANTLVINGGTIDNTTTSVLTIGANPETWNASFTFGGTHTITTAGSVTMTNNITYTNNNIGGGGLVINGSISGNFALTVGSVTATTAIGPLTLGGANSYSTLNVLAGTVTGNSATAFGAGTVNLGGASGSENVTLTSGFAGTIANPISVTAGSTGSAVIADTAASTYSGAVTLANNLTLTTAAASMTLSGGITGTGNLTLNSAGAGVITLSTAGVNNFGTITNSGAGSAANVISAPIGSNVTGVIQNSATSSLSLNGVNSLTVVTIDAGTLSGNNASAFGAGTNTIALGAALGSANATLSSAFNGTIANPIAVTSGNTGTATITSSAAATFGGAVTLANNLTLTAAATNLTLTGGISGTGNLILNSTGAGAITVSGGGVNNVGTITTSGAGTGNNIISAAIGSGITSVTLNSANGSLTLSGVNSSFTGPVTVTAGTLIAASTNATGSGTVTLNGGTLASGATGTVPGNVVAGTGAHVIAPGGLGSVGTLTITGNLTTGTNTTLSFDEPSPGSGDLLVVTGTLNTTSLPILAFGTAPTTAGTYQLISNSSAPALASTLTTPAAPNSHIAYALDGTHPGLLDLDVTINSSAITGSWQQTAAGTYLWSAGANWTGGNVPGSAGDTATFATTLAGGETVQLNGQQNVGTLTLNPAGTGVYTFAPLNSTDALVLNNNSSGATLTNTTGSNIISAPVVLASNTTVNVASGLTLTLSGNVSGSGNLTLKTGTGTLALSNANSFSGTTTITNGSLDAANANALASTSSITVGSGAALELSGGITVPASTVAPSIIGTGVASFGAFTNLIGINTWAANITLATNGSINNLNASTTRIGTLAGTLTISGGISGTADLLIRNVGTLVLSGTNSYTGATEIASGTTQLGASNSLPQTTILDMGLTAVSGTFDLNGFNQAVAGFQITPGGTSTNAPTTGLLNVVTNSNATVASTLTFTTSVSESYGNTADAGGTGGTAPAGYITGNLSLVKLGAATFTLGPAPSTNPNSYTGSTTIGNGTFALGAAGALPSGTTVNFGATSITSGTGSATAGTLDLHGFAQTIAGLSVVAGSSTGSQVINSVSATAGSLTVSVPSGTTDTFSGSLGGTGSTNNFSLTQSGTGTLTLTGGNTYTGTTTISAGSLLAANGSSGSATGSGAVSVTGTGTLGEGTSGGTIAGPATATGGTLQGNSNSSAPLTFGSTVTLTPSSGASFQFILNAPNQQLNVPMISAAGTLSVPGNTAINLVNGGAEAIGTYYLIGYGSAGNDPAADLVLGTEPSGFNYALVDNTSSEVIDLSVTAVPEPASTALLGLAALGLLARRRRRVARR